MKYIHFYATGADILPVLHRLEDDQPVKYIPTGKRSEINRPIYLTWKEIPDLGIATNESGFLSRAYMVSPRDIKNVMYAFTDNAGRKQWLLSNGDNPDSVLLATAGLWTSGSLLPGNMRTLHDTSSAQRIMKRFLSSVKAEGFIKYDVVLVRSGSDQDAAGGTSSCGSRAVAFQLRYTDATALEAI